MLDSIYHMTLKLIENHIFGVKHQDFITFYAKFNGRHSVTLQNL